MGQKHGPVYYFSKYIELIFANDDLWQDFQLYISQSGLNRGNEYYEHHRDPECISLWQQMLDNMGGGWPITLFASASFSLLEYEKMGHDLDAELAALQEQKKKGITSSTIDIQNEDIINLKTDAIVNAANTHLKQGGGVCGSIFKAAGETALTNACQRIGRCEIGKAVITPAFNLKDVKHIIHAVGPKYNTGSLDEQKLLHDCYYNALSVARDNCCHSIGFPLIAAGRYGYPIEEAWKIALNACNDFIKKDPTYEIHITFVNQDDNKLDIGRQILDASKY